MVVRVVDQPPGTNTPIILNTLRFFTSLQVTHLFPRRIQKTPGGRFTLGF